MWFCHVRTAMIAQQYCSILAGEERKNNFSFLVCAVFHCSDLSSSVHSKILMKSLQNET